MLTLNSLEYLESPGLNVMLGQDFYPEGHQGGVVIIQNGQRVASNGDIRLEACPGQWQPVPLQKGRTVDPATDSIRASFAYPDPAKNRKGFNPIEYPDLECSYHVTIRPEGKGFRIQVDFDQALPPEWIGKVGFNLELFPALLFGKPYSMDNGTQCTRGLFPLQANGPGSKDQLGNYLLEPLARGQRLIVAPDSESHRLVVTSLNGVPLELHDGRGVHSNGWFILRSPVPANATLAAIEWIVTPAHIADFVRPAVIQYNQIGYHPKHEKRAYVELDKYDTALEALCLYRIDTKPGPAGESQRVLVQQNSQSWGQFLCYKYVLLDFSQIETEGFYVLVYGQQESPAFRIDSQVYLRNVWQPCLEYFLPVQMCHMRVMDGYRVWHGNCHQSDAIMAPINHNHFDGYAQGNDSLCSYQSGHHVPNLNCGGWHDAGDFDLRIESQAGTVYGLSLARELFGVDYDNTSINQKEHVVILRCPDGTPDILQQIEHGLLTILGPWKSMKRLYKGIVESNIADYVLLGDPINHQEPRWVFTEEHPEHELHAAAALVAAARVIAEYRPNLAAEALSCALSLWQKNQKAEVPSAISCAVELLIYYAKDAQKSAPYAEYLLTNTPALMEHFNYFGSVLARALPFLQAFSHLKDQKSKEMISKVSDWEKALKTAAQKYRAELQDLEKETPYGVPYRPQIWGAGWGIQHFGVQQFFLNRHLPEIFPETWMRRAFDFILGCHPGENNASFVSGVGAKSVTVGYGLNRADWSYIPGGSVSGTALIQPDLPELVAWPYFWQQTEYVLGDGTADWLFLALAICQSSHAKPNDAKP